MKSWTPRNLGSLIESVSETFKFTNRPVVFLNTSDILAGKFLHANQTDPKTLPGQAKKRIRKGDLLFSEIRPANKRYASVDFDAENYVVSTKLMVLRSKGEIDIDYLKLYLTSEEILDYLQMIAEDRSGTFPQITFDILDRMEISLPPLPEQKSIAAVLSSLDDKIDLLHRQNQTLEDMAGALFRHWFVEEAQADWEVGPLKQYLDIGIGRTPPRNEHQWFSDIPTDVKWISIKDLGNDGAYIFNTAEYLTRDAVEKFNIPVIPGNTVVLSFKMTVGRVAVTTEQMLSNEAIAHFKFKPDTPFTVEYLYLHLKSYQYDLLGSTSSIVTAINSAMIKDMEIIIPDRESMKRFDEVASGLFKKIRGNQVQIRNLESLRDTMLPKLMSGEVGVEV